jgi:hypothetical protein
VSYNPFRQIIKRLFVEPRRIKQPVPNVNEEDVSRVVLRDFSEEFDVVMAVLSEYGSEKWEREQARVRLAALKLAKGDLEKLKDEITAAKGDYRDVLAAAEYPKYFYTVALFGMKGASRKERQRMITEDGAQYEAWLRK